VNYNQQRRQFVIRSTSLLLGLTAAQTGGRAIGQSSKPLVEVWKSPTCGCCKEWITHLKSNGFDVKPYDESNNRKRAELGLPKQFASCHTALVQGYVIEGHVPAREVHRLLKERPKALGLAVPEMPIGSPGMDGPEYGGQKDPYKVLLISASGQASVYAVYPEKRRGRS